MEEGGGTRLVREKGRANVNGLSPAIGGVQSLAFPIEKQEIDTRKGISSFGTSVLNSPIFEN